MIDTTKLIKVLQTITACPANVGLDALRYNPNTCKFKDRKNCLDCWLLALRQQDNGLIPNWVLCENGLYWNGKTRRVKGAVMYGLTDSLSESKMHSTERAAARACLRCNTKGNRKFETTKIELEVRC
jgi:hypothetical protein